VDVIALNPQQANCGTASESTSRCVGCGLCDGGGVMR
jgi:hypothetical protein